MQNKELKEREENLKRMNESVMSAINEFNKDSDVNHVSLLADIIIYYGEMHGFFKKI